MAGASKHSLLSDISILAHSLPETKIPILARIFGICNKSLALVVTGWILFVDIPSYATNQPTRPHPSANKGEIVIELVFGEGSSQSGLSCTEGQDGKLAQGTLSGLVGKTRSVEVVTQNIDGPCANAVRELLKGILPTTPVNMVAQSPQVPSSPQAPDPIRSNSDSVHVKIRAFIGPSQSPLEPGASPRVQAKSEPLKSMKPITGSPGKLNTVPRSQSDRFSKTHSGETNATESFASRQPQEGLLFDSRSGVKSSSPSQTPMSPLPKARSPLTERSPSRFNLFQSSPSQNTPSQNTPSQLGDSEDSQPQKKLPGAGVLSQTSSEMESPGKTKDPSSRSSQSAVEKSPLPTLESKSPERAKTDPHWRNENFSLSATGGLGQVKNTGDDQVRTGPVAGFQLAFRGLIERVRIVLGAHAVWPEAGPATQGIFFAGQLEYDLLPRREQQLQGLLLLGGVRSFAASTVNQSESVRRIRPANESTPVLSNSLVIGAGHWSQLGPIRTLLALDLAPVLGSDSFNVAVSGRLNSCYALSLGLCAGFSIAHKDIQVGAKSGIAQFMHTAAGLALDLALD